MANNSQINLTSVSVQNIMNKRERITRADIGKTVRLYVQGNGNIVDVTDKAGNAVMSVIDEGVVATKKIFNVRATSDVAMSVRNKSILKAGLLAEKTKQPVKFSLTGDDKDLKEFSASELFNLFLNKTQVSFSVILPNSRVDMIGDGVEIAGKVQLITTDNGELITLDPSTVRVLAPEALKPAPKFDITALFSEDESDDDTTADENADVTATENVEA